MNRWISERRAALETAVDYWRAKHGDNAAANFHGIKGHVVWAGLEPLAFQALFPDWSVREDVCEINVEVSLLYTLSHHQANLLFLFFAGWSHRAGHAH